MVQPNLQQSALEALFFDYTELVNGSGIAALDLNAANTKLPQQASPASIPFSEENCASYWIPSKKTKDNLANRKQAFYTMPGIINDNITINDLHSLLKKYCPSEPVSLSAKKGNELDTYFENADTIEDLIKQNQFLTALNLTAKFLTNLGQGVGSARQNHSTHSSESLKIWFLRLKLLVLLNQCNVAWQEIEPFEDLDAVDLYFQYHIGKYAGRQGSMIPFEMRLLWADLPRLMGKSEESVERFTRIVDIIKQILESDIEGFSNQESFRNMWIRRLTHAEKLLAGSFYSLKDFRVALDILQSALERNEELLKLTDSESSHYFEEMMVLLCLIGRLSLQLGNYFGARQYFDKFESHKQLLGSTCDSSILVSSHLNSGYLNVFNGAYSNAASAFQKALSIEPKNLAATNNLSICLLYCGQLNEAINILEKSTTEEPIAALADQSLCTNLCTLYELLSSTKCLEKKVHLLKLAATEGPETFTINRLKL